MTARDGNTSTRGGVSLAGVGAAGVDGGAVQAEHVLACAQRVAAQHAEPTPGDAGSQQFERLQPLL
jgi:hypothetical protein